MMRGSGLWFPRFILFLSPKELQFHRSHSKSQHPTHSAEELKARAIMRLVWEKKRKGWKGVWGLVSILIALSFLNVQSYGQSPSPLSGGPLGSSQIGTIEFQNSAGTTLKKFSSPFIFKCSTGMTCSVSGRVVTVTSTGGGGSSFYQTIQNGGVAVAQEASLNFLGSFSCIDNPGNTSTDCKLSPSSAVSHQFVMGVDSSGNYLRGRPISTDLSDVSPTPATDGQILIFDGPSSTYIPGDPKVQGLAADGATTVLNPVEIGGYDTAGTPAIHRAIFINGAPSGTEYGEVVRTIPSGTQTVSVANFPATQPVSIAASVTVTQATGTNLHTVLDSGTTIVTQATGTNLHTVVDSAPTTAVTVASLPLPTGASTSANQSTVKAASTASVAVDTSSVVQISPNQPQLTTPLNTSDSYGFVNLLNASSATTTATGAAVRISTFSTNGTLTVTFASITGSPATCTIQLINYDSLSHAINNGPTLPITVANGTSTFSIKPIGGLQNAALISSTFSCVTFPTAGTITVDFSPSVATFTAFGYPNILGCYSTNGRTAVYAGQSAAQTLISMRWAPTPSTLVALVFKVAINVETTTAATVVGPAERELIGSTGYTVADTGGTTLASNKLDPNYPASQMTIALGNGTLTAGTRTLNSAPYSSIISWLPLLMTGVDIGGACGNPLLGTIATSLAWNCMGGMGPIDLWNATNNQNMPIVLRNNNGLHTRIGKDNQPASAAQRTMENAMWCEATQYSAVQ